MLPTFSYFSKVLCIRGMWVGYFSIHTLPSLYAIITIAIKTRNPYSPKLLKNKLKLYSYCKIKKKSSIYIYIRLEFQNFFRYLKFYLYNFQNLFFVHEKCCMVRFYMKICIKIVNNFSGVRVLQIQQQFLYTSVLLKFMLKAFHDLLSVCPCETVIVNKINTVFIHNNGFLEKKN